MESWTTTFVILRETLFLAEPAACVHAADDAEHAGGAADEPGAGRAAGQDPGDELPGAAGQAALGTPGPGDRGPGLGGGHRRGEGAHHEDRLAVTRDNLLVHQ